MWRVLSRLFDLREGEGRILAQAFATLFLLIAGHTILETARDAMFLSRLPPSRLTIVYAVLAGLSLVVSGWNTSFVRRFGRRNALACTLVVASYGTGVLHLRPPTPTGVFGLYVFSGILGTVVVAQFWLMAAQLFTVAQGRRLFGPIASGGVLGAVVGAGGASLALMYLPVRSLLLASSAIFFVTAVLVTTIPDDEGVSALPSNTSTPQLPPDDDDDDGTIALFRQNPYLVRIAAFIALSTAASLATDYLFKSTAARYVPKEDLGLFFARYYAALSALSLVVQLLLAGRLVRRVGVVGAVTVTPLLLFGGGIGSLLAGGVLAAVLVTKGVDGSLRHSLNRVSTELLWMPLASRVRDRGKAVVDTVLGRVVQAAVALLILALAAYDLATPRVLAGLVAVFSLGWLIVAAGLRRPYLAVFRHALSRGTLDVDASGGELDLTAVEALLEALSSPDESHVLAAITLLEQKKRERLIPGLILYHESEAVLLRALDIFGPSGRKDWMPLAERLLTHPSDRVRIAALRALGRAGSFGALRHAKDDASPAVRAAAAFNLVRTDGDVSPLEDPNIVETLREPGELGRAARLALIEAIRQNPDDRGPPVLLALSQDPRITTEVCDAMAELKDPQFIPFLMARLAQRDGRDAVRRALIAIGEPAFNALAAALENRDADPRIRHHVPRTISRFPTQRAADVLVAQLAFETIGRVRYKVLRGLGRLVLENPVKVDRARIEAELEKTLREYLRTLSLYAPIEVGQREVPRRCEGSGSLVTGLLEDKLRQSLERAFRLLQIAHRDEDLHRVYNALRSKDRRIRANAVEFLDALTLGASARREAGSRELLRIIADDLPASEKVSRGAAYLSSPPRGYEEALGALLLERDETLAGLAAYHALELDVSGLRDKVAEARKARPRSVMESLLKALPSRMEPLEPRRA